MADTEHKPHRLSYKAQTESGLESLCGESGGSMWHCGCVVAHTQTYYVAFNC